MVKYLWAFDKNRLLILASLYRCSDTMCGCDLTGRLKIPKNLLSHHIKTLKDKKFIKETKCGRNKHYVINEKMRSKVEQILMAVDLLKIDKN